MTWLTGPPAGSGLDFTGTSSAISGAFFRDRSNKLTTFGFGFDILNAPFEWSRF
jgi:hypothetical protein